jgi:predicted transcriptional regulator
METEVAAALAALTGHRTHIGSGAPNTAIAQVRYSHDAMIDLIIERPSISQNEIAEVFGYTPPWVSRVINSDAFQARLAERKGDIIDPLLIASVEERLRGIAQLSAVILQRELEATQNPKLAERMLELSTKALGFGARREVSVDLTSYVVHVPPKQDNVDWMKTHAPYGVQDAIEVQGSKVLPPPPAPTVKPERSELRDILTSAATSPQTSETRGS